MALPLQKDEAPFVDELPYWDLRDGVVVLEDGTLEVGVEVRLPSTTLSPLSDVKALHATILSTLGSVLPQKERLRLYIEAAPMSYETLARYEQSSTCEYPAADALTKAKLDFLDKARRDGKLVEYRAYLTCTFTPPSQRWRWVSLDAESFRHRHIKALTLRQKLVGALAQAGFDPVPLLSQGLFELIWRYFNPGMRLHKPPVHIKLKTHYPEHVLKRFPWLAPPTLRSQVSGSDLARRWDYLWYSGHYAQVVSMGNLPVGYTQGGMIGHLLTLPRLFWLTVDYVHEPYGPTVRALMAQARRLYAATGDTGGLTDYTDPTVRVGFKELDDALSHVSETGTHVYRVGLSMTLLDTTEEGIRRGTQEAVEAFTQLPGVKPIVETAGLFKQFVALAPCSGRVNERVFLTLQENAADFFPLDAPWRGSSQPTSLIWNRWDSLTSIDPFDPRSTNWNGIVVGASGTGKTFLMQMLLGDLIARGADVMIVDRGYGYQQLVDLFGGQTIPIEPGTNVSINPFDLPQDVTSPNDQQKGFLMALLRAMLPPERGASESLENAILSSAIVQTYARATTEHKVEGKVVSRFAGTRLSDLARVLVTLEAVGDRSASSQERDVARNLALKLQHWTGNSPFGQLIDRPTSIASDAPVLYYETSGLERHHELRPVGLLLIADLIWKRVSQNPGRKKVVVLDEVWSLLKVPQAAAFIVELYRRFRRYNAAVYAITQSLKDFQAEEARGILQNTTYHYLLRLPGEDDIVQALFHLPDRAMETFRSLSSMRGSFSEAMMWIRQEDGLEGGVIVLRPSPLEYWAYTTSAEEIVVRESYVKKHGELLSALQELAKEYPHGLHG